MRLFLLSLVGFSVAGCRLAYDGQAGDGDGDTASIVVFEDGYPAQGMTILFSDASGALVDTAQVGADGRASGTLPADGMVTAISLYNSGSLLKATVETFAGVNPGDSIAVGRTSDPWQFGGDVDVALTEPMAGAAYYKVRFGCEEQEFGDSSEVIYTSVSAYCAPSSMITVMGVAYDDQDNAIAHTSAVDVALPASITLPAWSTSFNQLDYSVTGLPLTATYLEAKVDEARNGMAYWYGYAGTGDLTEPATMSVLRPAGFPSDLYHTPCVYFESGGVSGAFITEARPPADETLALDFADILPEVATVAFDEADGTASLQIVSAGTFDAVDAAIFALHWTGIDTEVSWYVSVPPGRTATVTPALPDYLSNLRPSEIVDLASPMVLAFEADFIDSYQTYLAAWTSPMRRSEYLPATYRVNFAMGSSGFY